MGDYRPTPADKFSFGLWTIGYQPDAGEAPTMEPAGLALALALGSHVRREKVQRNVTRDWFKPGPIDKLSADIQVIARQYVDKMEAMGGECDFVKDIALLYPLRVIMSIIGVAPEEEAMMLKLTQELFGTQDPDVNRSGKDMQDAGEALWRRSLYTHWQRTFVHPMMANFDAPPREECTADRTVSNTPQQALTLLNDPSFVAAARALAQRAMKEPGTHAFEARLAHAFRLVLAREPTLEEAQGLKAFYATQLDHYTAEPADAAKLAGVGLYPTALDLDPPELAAWTQVARVLLNLNETLMRY